MYAVFLEEEQHALQPVPLAPFAFFKIGRRKVHHDGHVEVERAYYSVPHRFVGETLTVHFNRQYVKVLDRAGEVVAYHRTSEPGCFQTEVHHLPEKKSYSRETYQAQLLLRLQHLGPFCRRWADEVLKDRGVLGLRALKGVVHLTRKYSPEEINEACRDALHRGSLRYSSVAELCAGADAKPQDTEPDLLQDHPALRPLAEYQLFLDDLNDSPSNGRNQSSKILT